MHRVVSGVSYLSRDISARQDPFVINRIANAVDAGCLHPPPESSARPSSAVSPPPPPPPLSLSCFRALSDSALAAATRLGSGRLIAAASPSTPLPMTLSPAPASNARKGHLSRTRRVFPGEVVFSPAPLSASAASRPLLYFATFPLPAVAAAAVVVTVGVMNPNGCREPPKAAILKLDGRSGLVRRFARNSFAFASGQKSSSYLYCFAIFVGRRGEKMVEVRQWSHRFWW